MSVQDTSLDAFLGIRPEIGKRQKEVLDILEELKEATNTMMAQRIHLPINCVVGRTNELVKKDLIVEGYKDKCPITGKRAIFWKVRGMR